MKKIKESEYLKKVFGENEDNAVLKMILKTNTGQVTKFFASLKSCSAFVKEQFNTLKPFTDIRVWAVVYNEVADEVTKKTIAKVSVDGNVWTPEKLVDKRSEIVVGT